MFVNLFRRGEGGWSAGDSGIFNFLCKSGDKSTKSFSLSRLMFLGAQSYLHFAPREQPDCPSLRALREHILIVRHQRASKKDGPAVPLPPFRARSFSFLKGWPGLVPNCARRTI